MEAAAKRTETLCVTCTHYRLIISGKGSFFIHCNKFYENPKRYSKYPSQPILNCAGYIDTTERNG